MVKGHLRSRGIFIQRSRLRSSLNRVNAEGRAERKLTAIHRRVYFCPSPNYVWHLDGTHKLIRWRFVVHVGIDGYSRLVTFCQCSADNKAQTVLNLFKKAEEEYGLPLRVRTDFGVENVRVWQYMYEKRRNSNAVMVGSSVHNQRVERFHRDANMQVINTFYNEFMRLEEAGLLNPLSEADVFCLHLVYLSAINERLTEFIQAHNNHSLSTEHNWTPLQLFRMNYRLFQLQALDPSGSLDLRDIVEHSENNVSIPPIAPLPLPLLRSLRGVMQRNMQCDHFSLYCACVRFIRNVASPWDNTSLSHLMLDPVLSTELAGSRMVIVFTTPRQLVRLQASSFTSPFFFISFSTCFFHVCFGLPLSLLPLTLKFKAFTITFSSSFPKTWPYHRILLALAIDGLMCTFVFSCSLWYVIKLFIYYSQTLPFWNCWDLPAFTKVVYSKSSLL